MFLYQNSSSSQSQFLTVDELIKQILQNQSNHSLIDHTIQSMVNETVEKKTNLLNIINYYPPDYMSHQTRSNGGFIIDILFFIYLFLLLWIIIDSYFIHSIQYFCSVFRISPNVSGSTLMAIGTSAPEFLTGIINLSIGESNIVTGAIIGSSIFNVLAIPGFCGLAIYFVKDRTIFNKINFWPIMRDIIFYMITIIIFLLSIKDNSVDCLEAVMFICVYCIYICSLNVWSNITIMNETVAQKSNRSCENYFLGHQRQIRKARSISVALNCSNDPLRKPLVDKQSEPQYLINKKAIKFLVIPTLFRMILPYPVAKNKIFILTYFLSILWISCLTYLLTWVLTLVCSTFLISDTLWAIIIEAFCKNLPELASSILVIIKYKLIDMAICNAIGSNIFEILICLGIPWFVKILSLIVVDGTELKELGGYIIPLEDNMLYFVIVSLLLSLLAFIVIFSLTNWYLTIRTSVCFIAAYSLFLFSIFVFRINIESTGEMI